MKFLVSIPRAGTFARVPIDGRDFVEVLSGDAVEWSRDGQVGFQRAIVDYADAGSQRLRVRACLAHGPSRAKWFHASKLVSVFHGDSAIKRRALNGPLALAILAAAK